MNEYLIKQETIKATADAIRENLPIAAYEIIPEVAEGSADGLLVENSVTVYYREFIDEHQEPGADNGYLSNDTMVAYDYLPNNEGVITPVIYDTDLDNFGQIPDTDEPFFYVGTATIDGQIYDKWRKIEPSQEEGKASAGIYTWDAEAKQYVYTNVIVHSVVKPSTQKIDPADFPSKVHEVHEVGYNKGFNEAKTEYGEMFIQTVGGSGTTLDLTKIDNLTIIRAYAFCQHTNLTKVFLPKEITSIGENAFYNCTNLNTVFYTGSLQEWEDNVTVGSGNEKLLSAISFYNETDVSNDGISYWHYVNGIPTLWSSKNKGLEYSLLDDGTYAISGDGSCKDTILILPDTYKGVPITQIGVGAFNSNTRITKVSLGRYVTTVGRGAFMDCSGLKQVDLPESVVTLDENVFQSSGLTSIKIPSGVKTITKYMLSYCTSLEKVYLPQGLETIEQAAFLGSYTANTRYEIWYYGSESDWNNIDIYTGAVPSSTIIHYGIIGHESFTYQVNNDWTGYGVIGINEDYDTFAGEIEAEINGLPVISINDLAFYYNDISALTIPVNILSIGYDVFPDSLQEVAYEGNMLQWYNINHSNDPTLYMFNIIFLAPLPEYTDEQGITYTSSYNNTCYVCSSGAGVSEPDITIASYINEVPVTAIDSDAFNSSETIRSVIIGDTITDINSYAFANCTNLSTVEIHSNLDRIDVGAFENAHKLTTVYFHEGSGCKIIDDNAFYECNLSGSFIMPSNLQIIGNYAFYNAFDISAEWIDLPDNVVSIGDYAFAQCMHTRFYNFPETLKSIGSHAFDTAGCAVGYPPEILHIPASVETIDSQAFTESGYAEIVFEGTPNFISSDAFVSAYEEYPTEYYLYVPWSEGEVANAPWGTAGEVYYNS